MAHDSDHARLYVLHLNCLNVKLIRELLIKMKNNFLKYFLSKPPLAKKGEINYPFMDRFTLVHFMIGLVYGFLGFPLGLAVFLAIAWEFVENPLKVHCPSIFPHATADTLQNSIGDCVAVILGWTLWCAIFTLKEIV